MSSQSGFSYASRMGYKPPGSPASNNGRGTAPSAAGGGGVFRPGYYDPPQQAVAAIPRHTPSSANLRRAVVRILPTRTSQEGHSQPEVGNTLGPLAEANSTSRLLRDGAVDPLKGRSGLIANQLPTGLCDIWHPSVTSAPMQAGELVAMATAQGCGLYFIDCGYNVRSGSHVGEDLLAHYVQPYRRGAHGLSSSANMLANSSKVHPGRRLGEQSATELSGEIAMRAPVTTAEVMQGGHGVLPILFEKLLTDFKQPVSLSFFAFTTAERPVTDLLAPLIPVTSSERMDRSHPPSFDGAPLAQGGTLTAVNVPSVTGFLRLFSTVTATHSFRDARPHLSFGFIFRVGKVTHVALLLRAEHQTDAIGIIEGSTEHLSPAAQEAIRLEELMSGVAMHGASSRHPALASSLMATLATPGGDSNAAAVAQSALQHQFGSNSSLQDFTVADECSSIFGASATAGLQSGIAASRSALPTDQMDPNAWTPSSLPSQTHAINQYTIAERAAARARKLLCANVLSQIRRTMAVLHVKRQAIDFFKPTYVVRLHNDQTQDDLGMIPFVVGRCRPSADSSPAYIQYRDAADGTHIRSQLLLPNRQGGADYGYLQTAANSNFIPFANMEAFQRQQQASAMSQAALDILRQQPGGFVPGPGSLFGPYAASAPMVAPTNMFSPRGVSDGGGLPVPPEVAAAWKYNDSPSPTRLHRAALPQQAESIVYGGESTSSRRPPVGSKSGMVFPPERHTVNNAANLSSIPDFADEVTPRNHQQASGEHLVQTPGQPRFRVPTNTQNTTSGLLISAETGQTSSIQVPSRYFPAADSSSTTESGGASRNAQRGQGGETGGVAMQQEAAKPLLTHHLEGPMDGKFLQETLMYLKKEEVVCHTAHRELEKDYLHVLDAVEGVSNRNVATRAALKRVEVQNGHLSEELDGVQKRTEQLEGVKGKLQASVDEAERTLQAMRRQRQTHATADKDASASYEHRVEEAARQFESRRRDLEEAHRRIVRKMQTDGRERKQAAEAELSRLRLEAPSNESRLRREATVVGGEIEVLREHIRNRQLDIAKNGQQAEEHRARKADLERQLTDIRGVSGDVSSQEGKLQALRRDVDMLKTDLQDAERELAALDASGQATSQQSRIYQLQQHIAETKAQHRAAEESLRHRGEVLMRERRRILEHSELLSRMKLQTHAVDVLTGIAAKEGIKQEPLIRARAEHDATSAIAEMERRILEADVALANGTKAHQDKLHQLKHLRFKLIQLDSANQASESDPDLCRLEEQCRAELDEIARFRRAQHEHFQVEEEDLQRSRRVYLTLFLEFLEQINSELEAHEGDKPYFSGRPLQQHKHSLDSDSDMASSVDDGPSGRAVSGRGPTRGGFAAPTQSSSRKAAPQSGRSSSLRAGEQRSAASEHGVATNGNNPELFANRVNMKPTSAYANKAMTAIHNTHVRSGLTSAGIDGQASQSVEVGSKVCRSYLEWKQLMARIKDLSAEESRLMGEVNRQEDAADRTAGRIASRRQRLAVLDEEEQTAREYLEDLRQRLAALEHSHSEHRKAIADGFVRDAAHKRELTRALILEIDECEASIQLMNQETVRRKAEVDALKATKAELLRSLPPGRRPQQGQQKDEPVMLHTLTAANEKSSVPDDKGPLPSGDTYPSDSRVRADLQPAADLQPLASPSTFGDRLFGGSTTAGINDSGFGAHPPAGGSGVQSYRNLLGSIGLSSPAGGRTNLTHHDPSSPPPLQAAYQGAALDRYRQVRLSLREQLDSVTSRH